MPNLIGGVPRASRPCWVDFGIVSSTGNVTVAPPAWAIGGGLLVISPAVALLWRDPARVGPRGFARGRRGRGG